MRVKKQRGALNRREIITEVGGLVLAGKTAHAAEPDRMPPQVGDVLVFAFPNSAEGVVRSGSLHNELSLLHIDQELMSTRSRCYAAGPVLAVSAACTHTGCEVSGWEHDTHELVCPCHGSRFYVPDESRVVQGPATKPLAFLPIEFHQESIRVAGKFSRRVGPEPAF